MAAIVKGNIVILNQTKLLSLLLTWQVIYFILF